MDRYLENMTKMRHVSSIDMHQQRSKNCAPSIDGYDYVIRLELERLGIDFTGEPTFTGSYQSDDEPPHVVIDDTGLSVITSGAADYTDGIIDDGPIAYWRLGEPSGSTMTDSSGNALHGTYTGSPTLGLAGAITGNTAASFNGTTQYGTSPSSNLFDFGDAVTLECWLYLVSISGGYNALVVGINGKAGLWLDPSGKVALFKNDVSALVISSISVPTGQWNHIVATKNGATAKIYLNGADVTVFGSSGTIVTTGAPVTFAIARYAGAYYLPGRLDEVAIYNYAISAARVTAHYNAGTGAGGSAGTVMTALFADGFLGVNEIRGLDHSLVLQEGPSTSNAMAITDVGIYINSDPHMTLQIGDFLVSTGDVKIEVGDLYLVGGHIISNGGNLTLNGGSVFLSVGDFNVASGRGLIGPAAMFICNTTSADVWVGASRCMQLTAGAARMRLAGTEYLLTVDGSGFVKAS